MTQNAQPILEVRNLKQYFPITTGFLKTTMLKAVDDISFTIRRGETLGLVGESGCGKTTAGRTILHLYKPTSGEIIFDGKPVDKSTMHEYRRRAQMVFQDPYSSLNPRMTVGDIVAEPIDIHHLCRTKQERAERVQELLKTVGISGEQSTRYAHEFSGGQRQRIGIARALASNPEFIVCDEPVSALDVSIQAQVINMLEDLQDQLGLSYLFIAHDLSVVKHISNRIAVMYRARWSKWRPRSSCTGTRRTRTRFRSCRPCRCPTRKRRAARTASFCRATCPARCTCLPAARSAPAATGRAPNAPRPCRRCAKSPRVTSRPAITCKAGTIDSGPQGGPKNTRGCTAPYAGRRGALQ